MLSKMNTIETFEIDKLEVERIRLDPKFSKYYFKYKGGKALIELDGEMLLRSTHHVRVKIDGDNFKYKHRNTERYINITSPRIAEFIKRLEARMLEICKGPIQPSFTELSIHADEESDEFSFEYKCKERPTVTRMGSKDKAVNLDIDKLQGNHFKGFCIIKFYCLECKGKGFSDIKIILN